MFSHVCVGSDDFDRAGRFYDAVLARLGLVRRVVAPDGGPPALCWHVPGRTYPRFYVYRPFDDRPASAGNGTMVAFLATSPQTVREAHGAGLQAGGCDEGEPGPRPRYGERYYGAYLRDPDGNKIHIVDPGHVEGEPP